MGVRTGKDRAKNDFTDPALEIDMSAGETLALKPLVGMDASDGELTWTTSDEAVAMVSQDGVVTALMPGEALITATDEGGRQTAIAIRVEGAEGLTLIGLMDDGMLPDIGDIYNEAIVMEGEEETIGIEDMTH